MKAGAEVFAMDLMAFAVCGSERKKPLDVVMRESDIEEIVRRIYGGEFHERKEEEDGFL